MANIIATGQQTINAILDNTEIANVFSTGVVDTQTGTSIVSTKSHEANILLELQGNTSQFTTTGKNKFKEIETYTYFVSCSKAANLSPNGIRITYNLGADAYISEVTGSGTLANENIIKLIPVLPNTTYAFSHTRNQGTNRNFLTSYTSGKISLGFVNFNTANYTFTTASNCYYVSFRLGVPPSSSTTSTEITNCQLETGNSVTSFEIYTGGEASPNPSYKQTINSVGDLNGTSNKYEIDIISSKTGASVTATISLIDVVRKLGSVKDRIIQLTTATTINSILYPIGTWVVERNFGKVIFDGTESYDIDYGKNDFYWCSSKTLPNAINTTTNDIYNAVSNEYTKNSVAVLNGTSVNGFAITSTANVGTIHIRNLATTSVTSFKTFLIANPMTVIYQLATPTYEALSDTDQIKMNNIKTYLGTTTVTTVQDNSVQPALIGKFMSREWYSNFSASLQLADISSDNKITPSEKQLLKKEWDSIYEEFSRNNSQASAFSIVIEKATYESKYNALDTYINTTYSLFTNLNTTTSIDSGNTFRTKFKEYYTARTELLNAISKKAKDLAEEANEWVNNNGTNATDVYSTIKAWADDAILNGTTEINGGFIKADTITAEKLAIADFTNYCTVNSNILKSAIVGTSIVENDYIYKTASNQPLIPLSQPYKNSLKIGTEFYYEITLKTVGGLTDTPLIKPFIVILVNNNGTGTTTLVYPDVAQNVTDTFSTITGIIKIPSYVGVMEYFTVGVIDTRSTKQQIHIKEAIFRKRMSGELIVDGTLTGDKLSTDAIQSKVFTDNVNDVYSEEGTFVDLSGSGKIKSKNFAIDADGNAYFKGILNGTTGNIGGWDITETTIQSEDFTENNVSRFDENGNPNPAYVVSSGLRIDSVNKSIETPQITIHDDYIEVDGHMTVGSRTGDIGIYSSTSGTSNSATSSNSSCIGGSFNVVKGATYNTNPTKYYNNYNSGIFCGTQGKNEAFNSTIIGGVLNTINTSQVNSIIGGTSNRIYNNTSGSCILGGYGNIVQCDNSVIGGYYNSAGFSNQSIFGKYNIANFENQSIVGKFNDNKSTTLFEVGNGTSTSVRSNAFEVYQNGDAIVKENLTAKNIDATEYVGVEDSVNNSGVVLSNGGNILCYYGENETNINTFESTFSGDVTATGTISCQSNYICGKIINNLVLTGNTVTLVPFTLDSSRSNGDLLSFDDDGGNAKVVIGANVNMVQVNAQLYYATPLVDGTKYIHLFKNGEVIHRSVRRVAGTYHDISLSVSVPVQQGDELEIKAQGANTDLISNSLTDTFFQVTKLN